MAFIRHNPDGSTTIYNDTPGIGKTKMLGHSELQELFQPKGVLYKTSCYLAGPMEFDSNGKTWRDEITPFLKSIGVRVFDPYTKPFIDSDKLEEGENARELYYEWLKNGEYDKVAERMKPIRNFDLNCVDRADFLIFYINKNIPTFGTMEELVTAVRMKRPIFIFVEGGKSQCPLWLFGMLNHKYFYENIEEIKNILYKINNGTESINNDKWRLLKHQFR